MLRRRAPSKVIMIPVIPASWCTTIGSFLIRSIGPLTGHNYYHTPNEGVGVHVIGSDGSGHHRISANYANVTFDFTRRFFKNLVADYEVSDDELDVIVEVAVGTLDSRISGWTHFDVHPDSTRIVYSACTYPDSSLASASHRRLSDAIQADYEQYNFDIIVSKIDGTDPRRVTPNERIDDFPTWSPTDDRIAFMMPVAAKESTRELYIVEADGSRMRKIMGSSSAGAIAVRPPVWSPDGMQIAYVAIRDTGSKPEVAVYTFAPSETGASPKMISEAVSGPAWSPDGQRIALAKEFNGDIGLFILAADGSHERMVTTIADVETFDASYRSLRGDYGDGVPWIHTMAWSPDGKFILYSCDPGVCVVDLDGKAVGESPFGYPDFDGYVIAAWSPDSARIAVQQSFGLRRKTPHRGSGALYTMAPDGSGIHVLLR